ncbi:hypothetical protein B0T11DRAFT_85504 [Plectosphaerella cucumerina]|uniref:Uncharacterized protein n=1 Tax=Plectosphaerella cucumerina TaxID=40658 RepID=A0A8K0TJD1_9PEZI|nr:hypothetical protein B0T11DRAFT_85504 [Plectosphaerella cucumerina]
MPCACISDGGGSLRAQKGEPHHHHGSSSATGSQSSPVPSRPPPPQWQWPQLGCLAPTPSLPPKPPSPLTWVPCRHGPPSLAGSWELVWVLQLSRSYGPWTLDTKSSRHKVCRPGRRRCLTRVGGWMVGATSTGTGPERPSHPSHHRCFFSLSRLGRLAGRPGALLCPPITQVACLLHVVSRQERIPQRGLGKTVGCCLWVESTIREKACTSMSTLLLVPSPWNCL